MTQYVFIGCIWFYNCHCNLCQGVSRRWIRRNVPASACPTTASTLRFNSITNRLSACAIGSSFWSLLPTVVFKEPLSKLCVRGVRLVSTGSPGRHPRALRCLAWAMSLWDGFWDVFLSFQSHFFLNITTLCIKQRVSPFCFCLFKSNSRSVVHPDGFADQERLSKGCTKDVLHFMAIQVASVTSVQSMSGLLAYSATTSHNFIKFHSPLFLGWSQPFSNIYLNWFRTTASTAGSVRSHEKCIEMLTNMWCTGVSQIPFQWNCLSAVWFFLLAWDGIAAAWHLALGTPSLISALTATDFGIWMKLMDCIKGCRPHSC